MNLETLTTFFMWCTIINGGVLVFWSLIMLCCSGPIYRIHSRLFGLSRESFNVTMYAFLGLCKILYTFFILVPYIALLIVG